MFRLRSWFDLVWRFCVDLICVICVLSRFCVDFIWICPTLRVHRFRQPEGFVISKNKIALEMEANQINSGIIKNLTNPVQSRGRFNHWTDLKYIQITSFVALIEPEVQAHWWWRTYRKSPRIAANRRESPPIAANHRQSPPIAANQRESLPIVANRR